MSIFPNDTLAKVLELRTKNGLDATPEALTADLETAKCKWTLEETPRYRRAGDSPIFVSGKYLTTTGICPATGEKDTDRPVRTVAKNPSNTKIEAPVAASEEVFYRVLHGKGFDVRITKDLLTGEILQEVPKAIENLDLAFGTVPNNTTRVHITQTSPQIQVSMSLDKFLELAAIKP